MLRFENSDSQLNMLERLWIILDPISVCHHTTFSVNSCSRLSKHRVEPSLCGPQRTLVTLITTSIGWDTAEWAVVNVVSSGSRGQRWRGGELTERLLTGVEVSACLLIRSEEIHCAVTVLPLLVSGGHKGRERFIKHVCLRLSCLYMCTCMHKYIHIHIYTHTYTYTYKYMHTYS